MGMAMSAVDPNEYGTPDFILDAAREVLGRIDLDPFSSAWHNVRVGADCYYDGDSHGGMGCGLATPWTRGFHQRPRVWCNPPYSNGMISLCVDRWICAVGSDEVHASCLLTNVDTSVMWCQRLMAWPHCTLTKRVSHHHPTLARDEVSRGNRYAQMVTYAGCRYPEFVRVFGALGVAR